MDTSNRSPMIMFNTYMNQFTCSGYGILIREKSPLIWILKEKSKSNCFLCEELIKTNTPDFTRGKLHERVCTTTNDECKLPNCKCVLRECTVCRAIALPAVEWIHQ